MALTPPSPPSGPSPGDPDQRERWLFLLSGALLLLTLLVAIGRERRWGEPHFRVDVVAPRADGLQEGMEVRLSGMPIGRVESLQLRPDARVAVTLQINARHRALIGPRSRAQSSQVGLVGPSFVNLSPDPLRTGDPAKRPLPPLAYDPPPDLHQLLADLNHSRRELDHTLTLTSRLLRQQVPPSLAGLRTSTTQLSRSMGDLTAMSQTVASETRRTVPSVRRTLAKADDTLRRANQTADTAAKASKEAELLLRQARPNLIPTLGNLQEITAAVNQLVRFVAGLGLLEPGPAKPPSAPAPSPAVRLDPHKVHPTSPDPSLLPP